LSIGDKVAHVWFVDKTAHLYQLERYWLLLNESEQERANKFRFFKDKSCSIIARGVLRTLLGAYLNLEPATIQFDTGSHGKPFVKEAKNLNFNVSHSANSIVFSFTRNYEIGIDVEKVKKDLELIQVAKSFFSTQEIKSLFEQPESYRYQAFFNCWTRKEAFIKAEGSGLSFPLDQFTVSLDNAHTAALLETKWDPLEYKKWHLTAFTPQKDYIGALAIKGDVDTILYKKIS